MNELNNIATWSQIISLPVAIIAILVMIWIYYRGKHKAEIVCEFDPILFPIEIKAGKALDGDIEIRYDGRVIDNLFFIRVKVKNTGNQLFRKSAVIEPIKFDFGSNVEMVKQPQVIYTKPNNLKVDLALSKENESDKGQSVILDFELFNPNEEIAIEFLCTGATKLPNISARIEALNEIKLTEPKDVYFERGILEKVGFGTLLMAILVLTFAGLIQDLLFFFPPVRDSEIGSFIFSFIIIIALLIVLWFLKNAVSVLNRST
jgi:hypothetical protein